MDINQPEQASLMAAVDTLIPCPVLQAATCDQLGAESPVQYTECQLQAAHSEGILLTDLSRKLFFQRHFSANSFIYAGIDHRDKAYVLTPITAYSTPSFLDYLSNFDFALLVSYIQITLLWELINQSELLFSFEYY